MNIAIYHTHRHPDIWDKPNEFIPERWSADNVDNIPKYAYLPFGGGPRICIGNSFATMEANLLLATIAQHYQFRLIDGVNVTPQPFITMYPRDGLPMRIEKRQPNYQQEVSQVLEMA